MRRIAQQLFLIVLLCATAAVAAPEFPPLSGRVVDQADVIPPQEEAQITDMLAAHEQKSRQQVVVATVKSLGGEPIEDYGVALGRAWGIGEKGKDTGVILLVAPNEREVRIEVGYGLEGELTDAITKLIIEGSILPRFKAGDIPGGIRRGAEDIVAVLGGDAAAFAQRAKERVSQEDSFSSAVSVFIFMVIMMIWLGVFGRGRRRRYRGGPWGGPVVFGGGSGSGWGSGSSGSSGGFSGGGGSFGGGGASGKW